MKLPPEGVGWVLAQLAVITIGVAFIVYVALPVPSGKLIGGFFVAIGMLNAIFYRGTGRKLFAATQSSAPFVARFWAHGGEGGIQSLVLGMGIILAVAGCTLLVLGRA